MCNGPVIFFAWIGYITTVIWVLLLLWGMAQAYLRRDDE